MNSAGVSSMRSFGDATDYPQFYVLSDTTDPDVDHFNEWALTMEVLEELTANPVFLDTGPKYPPPGSRLSPRLLTVV